MAGIAVAFGVADTVGARVGCTTAVAVPCAIGVLVSVGTGVGKIAAVAVGGTRVAVGIGVCVGCGGSCVGGSDTASTVNVVEVRLTPSTLTVRRTSPTAMSGGSGSVTGIPSHALP